MNKKLWVWKEPVVQLPGTMAEGRVWPKISIVTPSYNQGHYIEETILSVLNQGYPNLEYIIIDGGSTDNTVDIIKKYGEKISFWVSEKDNGQTHAINKGFEMATGEILAYLNSDDIYMPYTFRLVAELFTRYDLQWLTGHRSHLIDGDVIAPLPSATTRYNSFLYQKGFHVPWILGWNQQPSTFWSAKIFNACGRRFDEQMQCSFDIDMWINFSRHAELVYVRSVLAMMRQHAQQKSRTLRLDYKEIEGQAKKYNFYPLWKRKALSQMSRVPLLRKFARTLLRSPEFSSIDWNPLKSDWEKRSKLIF